MKKFMKTCAIIMAIMLGLSLILMTIGGCGGGMKGIRYGFWRGFNCYGCHIEDFDDWGDWLDSLGDDLDDLGDKFDDWGWGEDWNTYSPNENGMFSEAYDIIENQDRWSQSFSAENIRNLEIALGGCEVTIGKSPDADFHVSAKTIKKLQVYAEGNTLHIRVMTSGKINVDVLSTKVEILIPENAAFDTVDAALGAGDFKMESLRADKIKIELGAGRLQIEEALAKKMEIELGAGQIVIKDAAISEKLDAELGAGELRFVGSVPGDMDVECGMGNADIHIKGSTEEEHNYDLECSAGNLTVGSRSHSGIVYGNTISNGADSTYKLSCFMGNIRVTFSD